MNLTNDIMFSGSLFASKSTRSLLMNMMLRGMREMKRRIEIII